MRKSLVLRAIAILITGALGACTASTVSGPSAATGAMSTAQSDSVGEVLTLEASSLVDGSSFNNAQANAALLPSAGGPSFSIAATSSCSPAISPTPVVDTDGDIVPDSIRVDFTGCSVAFPLVTVALAGTIDVVDPTPTTADLNARLDFTNFTRSETLNSTGKTRTAVRNGVRTRSGDSNSLQHSETAFQTVYTFRDGSTATHVRTWSAAFTADTPGSIKADSLPNGNWNITGTSTWTRGSNTWDFSVTTNPQLHYNATCSVAPRFDSGTMTVVVTRGTLTSTVTIQFTACGQYTVTRS